MARPPIAQLIYEHRVKLGLSIRQAAALAGISEGSWRRTESDRKLTRTPETIARMAGAVDISGEQLTKTGWPAAAQILAIRSTPQPSPPDRDDDLRAALEAARNWQAVAERMESKLDRVLADREHRDDKEDDLDEPNGSRRAG